MKSKITSLLIISVLMITTLLFLTFPKEVMESVIFSISLWKDNLLPSLFPFFIISELLINYGIIDLLEETLKSFMNKVFHLPGSSSFVLIGSIISGFPSSSKYVNELLINNKINIKDAEYLLKFNHFSNPLFVVGTIGTMLLNNKKLGILILIVHIVTNFIIAIIYKPKDNTFIKENSSLIKGINQMHKKRTSNNFSFSEILATSIFKTFKTLLLLLGIITFFIIIGTLIKKVIPINNISYALISGLLEMTGGIKNISELNIPLNIKATIITFFISFGGLSIHMQVMSILSDRHIKYFPYFISRLLHGLISSSIIYIILLII